MTFRSLLQYGVQYLEEHQVADASVDAWLLMEFVWNMNRSCYFLHADDIITEGKKQEYLLLLLKRGNHIPLQHLTHTAYFMGLSFYVNEHVLIPRMDTEVLVETALASIPRKARVLDMCTGSGCILLSLLHEQKDCSGLGVDISEEALKVAGINGERLGINAEFLKSNLFEKVEGIFDLIVSNPPYIPSQVIPQLMSEVKDHEPVLALDGKADGLYFYRKIISQAWAYLKPDGWLMFEIGSDQGEALDRMLTEADYEGVRIIKDLAGHDRVAIGQKL